jgi:hypothetical protein
VCLERLEVVLSTYGTVDVKSDCLDPAESNRPNERESIDECALRNSHPALRDAAMAIGRGWYSLVQDLFEQLPRDVVVSRIKEKDGELQVFLVRYPAGSDEAIWRATALSRYTCAACGEPGKVVDHRGWMKAVCDVHEASWKQQAGT